MDNCFPVMEVVNVPGSTGDTGAGGLNGTNAFTILIASLTLPTAGGNVTASVGSSLWMSVGQPLYLGDGVNKANFVAVSFPGPTSVVLQFVNNVGDAASGTVFAANSSLVATGTQGAGLTTPISVANGGTGGNSLANNQLGLPFQFVSGNFTLNGSTSVTVVDTNVTVNSLILLSLMTVGGTVGAMPHLKTITPGTGFTVSGTAADVSVYGYMIFG